MAKKKKKNKLWDINNVLITLKAMVVGIVAGLPTVIFRLVMLKWLYIGIGLSLLYVPVIFFLWGYLANKFWGWK